jgi:hypothetical protein
LGEGRIVLIAKKDEVVDKGICPNKHKTTDGEFGEWDREGRGLGAKSWGKRHIRNSHHAKRLFKTYDEN